MISLEQSIKVVETAMELANSKGAFTLQESATIFSAVGVVKKCVEDSLASKDAQKDPVGEKPAPTKKTTKK